MTEPNGRDDELGEAAANSKAPECPICGKPRQQDYRPFCSKRCADVDLGRWLNGRYAIPVEPDADEDGDDPASGEKRDRPNDGGAT